MGEKAHQLLESMKSSSFNGPANGVYSSRLSTSLDLWVIEIGTAQGRRRKRADLAGFGCGALLSVKDADGTYVRVPQFSEYTMPTDDMPVGVRHGGKMKALSDQGAITADGCVRCQRSREGAHITTVFPRRDRRRSGSFLNTCGLGRRWT